MPSSEINSGRFRKVVIVDAWRWDPVSPQTVLGVLRAAGVHYAVLEGGRLGIGTLESGEDLDGHVAKPGDWVLRGPAGEFYAHDAALFAHNYVRADAGDVRDERLARKDASG